MDIQLADILTIGGAVAAAGLVSGLVELLKRTFAVVAARSWERPLALLFSLLLVVLAFVDQGVFELAAAFTAFVAWLAIAKLATGIYDEIAQKPGAIFTAPGG